MFEYQKAFLEFCIEKSVLRFGEFTLKSGRVSPYFFNAGLFNSGASLNRLAEFYARTLEQHLGDNVMLFGPAYKGIPLVTAVAMAMDRLFDRDLSIAFNRKEAKDHGEGGSLVGAPLEGEVVIVDDVITAGTSVGESVELIRAAGARPAAVLIALDREEIVENSGGRSAVQMVAQTHGLPVYAIARLGTLVEYLGDRGGDPGVLHEIEAYRARYGAADR
ncbi:MAG: orotate phosphoribosyltransferase [Proteobacteria bacterium]|nr:MAG: orotate phosphoribosyltransferase [Pseudomonadota bacterium]